MHNPIFSRVASSPSLCRSVILSSSCSKPAPLLLGLDAERWVSASTLEAPPGICTRSVPTHYSREELCSRSHPRPHSRNPSIRYPLLPYDTKVGSITNSPVTPWHWIVSQGMAIQHPLWPFPDCSLTTGLEAVSLMNPQISSGHNRYLHNNRPSSAATSTLAVSFSSTDPKFDNGAFCPRRGDLLLPAPCSYSDLSWAGHQVFSPRLQVSTNILPWETISTTSERAKNTDYRTQ